MKTTTRGDGAYIDSAGPYPFELEISTEIETYRHMGGYVRDPEWIYIDKKGHRHAYDANGALPTLKAKWVPCDGSCGDPTHKEIKHYRCRECREKIKPGTRYEPPGERYVLGPRRWEAVIYITDSPCIPVGDELDVSFQQEGRAYRGRGAAVSATCSNLDCPSITVQGTADLEMISHG